jgi:putative ABC transport system permease protein
MLMALGVLAMALGLLRTETAGDLRILTTTGAGSRTRRTTLVTTAGDLAFLGAALGTIISYLVLVAFFAEQSQHPFDRNSGKSHLLIIMGMPVLVSIGGWIFSGHEPKAIARQPLK